MQRNEGKKIEVLRTAWHKYEPTLLTTVESARFPVYVNLYLC